MTYSATHEELLNSIAPLQGMTMPDANTAKSDTLVTAAQRLVMVYRLLIPALMLLSNAWFFPAQLRGAFTILLQALDLLAAATPSTPAPSSPVVASAASDTTTDPTSTDPSFKAGKDL